MSICIICRKEKNNFNDEHVIPDSIGGCYHIKKICVQCNSTLGSNIDNKLTNHKFIEFQRNLLSIKGKSGNVPNPFRGIHSTNESYKVKIEVSDNNNFEPRLIPVIPDFNNKPLVSDFTIKVDKRDEDKVDSIIEKILKRNGIDKNKVTHSSHLEKINPKIRVELKVDLQDFKSALLKIAYEFAVDQIQEYFEDPIAIKISKLLFNHNLQDISDEIQFIGSGFNEEVMKPFQHLIDFDNNNHYLILTDSEYGLICFINLFNGINIGIIIGSSKKRYLHQSILVGKNDISLKTFEIFDIHSIFNMCYSPMEYKFEYYFKNTVETNRFLYLEQDPNFTFYQENGKHPLFDEYGEKLFDDMNNYLLKLPKVKLGDSKDALITKVEITDDIFIKFSPSHLIFKIIGVEMRQTLINKI